MILSLRLISVISELSGLIDFKNCMLIILIVNIFYGNVAQKLFFKVNSLFHSILKEDFITGMQRI